MATLEKEKSLKEQKDFLKEQINCGYPRIERRARRALDAIESAERQSADFSRNMRITTYKIEKARARKDYWAERRKRRQERLDKRRNEKYNQM